MFYLKRKMEQSGLCSDAGNRGKHELARRAFRL